MAYTAFYRKYRPAVFGDVRGQEHVVTTLTNQIDSGRLGHAYLFCGSRGTGKTTVAKILAKAANCENPKDGSPCGVCECCRSISAGTSMNVIEIDAASNNGVDNIRQIREEVAYPPTEGRYRVYIIDEAHMLSAGAFNALLKTLEEPPSYVIFILATTEFQKIPVTILSRCQRYDFHRILPDLISGRLSELAEAEGIEAEDKAYEYLARVADGSMRDALSLFDQCAAFYLGEKISLEKVRMMLGAVDTEVFGRLTRALCASDVGEAVSIAEEMAGAGREAGQFVNEFIGYLRDMLLICVSGDLEDVAGLKASPELKREAKLIGEERLLRYIRTFCELSARLRGSTQKKVETELALIRLCRPAMDVHQDALIERIESLERQVSEGGFAAGKDPGGSPNQAGSFTGRSAGRGIGAGMGAAGRERKLAVMPTALKRDVAQVGKNWKKIIKSLPQPTRGVIGEIFPSTGDGNQVILVFDDAVKYQFISDERRAEEISKSISKYIGKEIELVIKEGRPGENIEECYPNLEEIANTDIEIIE